MTSPCTSCRPTLSLERWTPRSSSKDRSYVFEGKGVFSSISGDASAIRALQTNPVHLYQRPDASHLGVDPSGDVDAREWGHGACGALREEQVVVV